MNLAHLHLVLNHLPVLGTGFGLALLIFGLWRRSDELKKTALGVLVLVALAAVPVYLTGEPAEELVQAVPGVSKPAGLSPLSAGMRPLGLVCGGIHLG